MSDSVRPHRRQPTRLRHPWDSPGKNTGVGCHFLLQCMKAKSESEVAQRPHGLQSSRLLHPWDFPGKGTGVGCHCLPPKGLLSIILNYSYTVYSANFFCHKYFPHKQVSDNSPSHGLKLQPTCSSWNILCKDP